MKYYSLGNPNIHVSAKEALLQGLAPDGSLYMPERIPRLDEQFLHSLEKYGMTHVFLIKPIDHIRKPLLSFQ